MVNFTLFVSMRLCCCSILKVKQSPTAAVVGAVPERVAPFPLTVSVVMISEKHTLQICPSVGLPGKLNVSVA
jgi:hypothetical protein